MRKVMYRVLIFLILIGSVFTVKAYESDVLLTHTWIVDGKEYKYGEISDDGAVSYKLDDTSNKEAVLVLNNYDGGAIILKRNDGTLVENASSPVYIKLVGDNTITVGNGVGITSFNEIEFIGDGTLTIEANEAFRKEISTTTTNTGKSITMRIVGKDYSEDNCAGNLDTEKDSQEVYFEFDEGMVAFVIIGMFGGTFMVISVILIVQLAKDKYKNTSKSQSKKKK